MALDIDLLDKNSQLGAAIAGVVFIGASLLNPALGLSMGQAFLFGYGTTLATSTLTKALMPQPELRGGDQGYQITQRGSTMPHQIIYGKTRIAGGIVFQGTTQDNKYLHTVLAFTGHEVEEFETIYFNDEVLTLSGNDVTSPPKYAGKVKIVKKLGTTTQNAVTSSDLGVDPPSQWTTDCKLLATAYLYVMLEYDADAFPNGVPEVTAIVKGKKVYDPRTGSTAWSDNPALCLRDYITSGKGNSNTTIYNYGISEDIENVDDTLVSTAANICDQIVTLPDSTTQNRFTLNGAFTTNTTPYDAIQNLSTAMGGLLWYAQGKWRMKPAYYTSPVLDLNEDDLRSGISVNTRHSRRDNFNVVKGTFRGPKSDYQPSDFPQVPILNSTSYSSFLAADGGQESVVDIQLPFTDDPDAARRLALITLERNRQQLTAQATFGLRAFQVQVGDIVRLNNTRFGWIDKEFEVVTWDFGVQPDYDLLVNMTLREISESVFDDISDGAVYESDNTTLPSAFDVPAVSINTTQDYRIINEHVTNVLVIDIGSGSAERVDYVEIEYKKSTETTYAILGTGDLGRFEILDIETPLATDTTDIFYDIRARAINSFGVKGDFTTVQVEVEADTVGPSAPAIFEYQLSGGTLFLNWTASTDLDLSYYKILHNSSTTAVFEDVGEVPIIQKVARPSLLNLMISQVMPVLQLLWLSNLLNYLN
jgi:hypothetical protein